MQTAEILNFTRDDYLNWEAQQEIKHEYIKGEVFAMGGARREHVVVCLNIASSLKQKLRQGPCRAYMADMKLLVEQADAFFYPDVVVSCDEHDNQAEQYLSKPSLIVEVLSDTTEGFDRGKKFIAYRTLTSLKEYVMVDIKQQRVECYRRKPGNEWLLHDYTGDSICAFTSLDIELPLSEIFEDLPETKPDN